jgi:cytosine/adenosine deaminase-related metal-dependent hydrolase
MMPLVIKGRVIPLAPSDPDRTFAGRVFLNDAGTIEAVTDTQGAAPAGFEAAPVVDVGDALVIPGLIDLHNHLGYNALPLWAEPAQKQPFRHHNDWTDAPTYRASIAWPAWVLAKAEPEAMLAYVQTRALVGGTTAAQGWPAYNRAPQMVLRNIDTEDGGTGDRDLIYTSALTKQPLELAKTAQKMRNGAGFIYHCSEGQQGSVVGQEFADAADAGCLLKTFIGIHCNALADTDWTRWPQADAGAVVWSPFSNLWLYGSTTNIPEAKKRRLLICLGSDWGPSGTKHVLAELKVATLASDAKHFGLSNRDLVQMVTSNAGAVLSRCWRKQIGTLTTGAFGDVTVLRSSGNGDVWSQIVNATERDVLLVVVGGIPRYGESSVMTEAGAGSAASVTIAGIKRKLMIPNPADPTTSWRWTEIVDRLNAVRKDPAGAVSQAEGRRRAYAGPMDAAQAPLELALDMPSGGAMATAGPPPDPAQVVIPPLPTLVHDEAFFQDIRGRGFHGGLLDGLAAFYK